MNQSTILFTDKQVFMSATRIIYLQTIYDLYKITIETRLLYKNSLLKITKLPNKNLITAFQKKKIHHCM